MSNRYFGLSSEALLRSTNENSYARSLNQDVGRNSSPSFGQVYCETPVVERYEDIIMNPAATKPGANAPDFVKKIDDAVGATGLYLWSFPANKQTDLFFIYQINHSWKEGSELRPHIHWGQTVVESGKHVTWQFEYTIINVDEVCTPSTVLTIQPVCPTARTHIISHFTPIDATGKKISCVMPCRLSRVPTGVNESTQGATLLSFDLHHIVSTMGSSDWGTK